MIKQVFNAEQYWKVIVYFNIDYNFFDDVLYELMMIDFPKEYVRNLMKMMMTHKAQAVTCSSTAHHTSIVLFNTHTSEADYINSIVHEAEHVKQAILKAYMIEDDGEMPAYTIGYLVMKMYETFKNLISQSKNK